MRRIIVMLAATTAICMAAASVMVGLSLPTGASSPPEFAAVTTTCAAYGVRTDYPAWTVTLYNLPPSASPTLSGTITSGNSTDPLSSVGFIGYGSSPWAFDGPFPSDSFSAGSSVFSITWDDGQGGGGSHTQIVGFPNCNVFPSRQVSAMAASQDGSTYWVVTADGYVMGFGPNGRQYGDMANLSLNAPIVGMAALPGNQGYWLLGGDGGVFSFGLARFYGSTGGLRLNSPVVGIATTPDGGGYWLVASDGGVFAYGDASFYGSMGGQRLNTPIVGMAVDQATGGYWLVSADGGVYAFDAPFHGSTGGLVLSKPIIGMEASPDGSGYRLAARDGGVFSFGLPFAGSWAGQDASPMVGITGSGSGGYRLLDSCGGVFSFGSAPFNGSYNFCS